MNFSEGKVVRLGRESVHVVVLGLGFLLRAAITFEEIREDFKYKIVRKLSAIPIARIVRNFTFYLSYTVEVFLSIL